MTVCFGLSDEKKMGLKHQITRAGIPTAPTVLKEISNQNKSGLEYLPIRTTDPVLGELGVPPPRVDMAVLDVLHDPVRKIKSHSNGK